MLKCVVTNEAQNDIDHILMNVLEYTGFIESALKLEGALHDKFSLLSMFPYIGRVRENNIRETFVNDYRVVYQVFEYEIHILTVIHSRRLYPKLSLENKVTQVV